MHLLQLVLCDFSTLANGYYQISGEFLSPCFASCLVLNLHVQVERAFRTVSLIAPEVRALMSFLNFVVAPAEMSLSATRINLILTVSSLISDLTLIELCRHRWKRRILSLALFMVICSCI